MPPALPVDAVLPEVRARLAEAGRLVLVAPPGAGKSTRVPPALVDDGKVLFLQPRRVAARALARRIAAERGWTLGREVGWQVRFERRFTKATRLLVATEGILTARLRDDPFLEGFRTVVLDELHERSLHADLALALVREAARARGDLRVVAMSATLDAGAVAAYLGDDAPCPVVQVASPLHEVAVESLPDAPVADGVRAALAGTAGDVLAFLPGMREITRAREALAGVDAEVHVLHGSLPAAEQDAALAPAENRKVILATNVAETSLTVEGVTAVVDSGLHKVLRFDPAIELDRLETERIGADSAEQRKGRAGRLGPGRCYRLWDPRETLRPFREPEIRRVDLTATALDVLAWGGDPATLPWFEAPPAGHLDHALEVLRLLGAVDGEGRLTARGRALVGLPLSPRLATVLLEAGGGRDAARLCALLGEGGPLARRFGLEDAARSRSDLLVLLDHFDRAPPSLARAAREIERRARGAGDARSGAWREGEARPADGGSPGADEETLLRAVLAGFPDRVARRRAPGEPRLHLASGHGAVQARESTVRDAELVVALDVTARRGEEALVRVASAVERAWLRGVTATREHRFDAGRRQVRAFEVERYLALTLSERPAEVDPVVAGEVLVAAALERLDALVPEETRARLAFAEVEVDLEAAVRGACAGRTHLPELDLLGSLPFPARRAVEEAAPAALALPSGRSTRLEYRPDGTVVASAKLQELFGLTESPRLGPRRTPVLLSLLAPSGRPVQLTDDLASFWSRTYPEVRKELRGRYPKHPWPEDPLTATPTHRAKPRKR